MIGIYDKGHMDSTFGNKVRKTKVCTNLNELKDCELAIAHVYMKDWDRLIKEYSDPYSVRVRVSIGGFHGKPPPTISENDVYVFHLVPSTDSLNAEWQEILCGLSDKATVESLVRGENPGGLRRFFVHEVQAYLAALTILCEGYLAVHSADIACHADISPALKLMKWTEFRNSARGRKLIQPDLSDKMSNVRQPEWWLKVFERESVHDEVRKEWADTTESELPATLNHLLEAICNGKAIPLPKIVADAYCVLARKNTITAPSDWQIRRSKFNHDWLKNKFLNSFNDFIEQLQKRDPDIARMSAFLEEDFPAWKLRQKEVQSIVQSFEDSMSPLRLLRCAPLNRCDVETQEWLGHLVHGLWLARYPVQRKAKQSQDALVAVNELYEKIAYELEQPKPIELTKLAALRPQFCELKATYQALSKVLSNLPRYEYYGG